MMITGPGATTARKALRLQALPSLDPIETPAPPAQASSAGTHLRAFCTEYGAGAAAYQCSYQLKSSPWAPVSSLFGVTFTPARSAAPNHDTDEKIGIPLPNTASSAT